MIDLAVRSGIAPSEIERMDAYTLEMLMRYLMKQRSR